MHAAQPITGTAVSAACEHEIGRDDRLDFFYEAMRVKKTHCTKPGIVHTHTYLILPEDLSLVLPGNAQHAWKYACPLVEHRPDFHDLIVVCALHASHAQSGQLVWDGGEFVRVDECIDPESDNRKA